MDSLFELSLTAAPKGSRAVSQTLHRQLRSGILEGRLKPGSRLPSTRSARSVFGVSRNTAQDIYDRLAHEGLVNGRHGSGTFVADPLPVLAEPVRAAPDEGPDPRLNPFWLGAEVRSWTGFWKEPAKSRSESEPSIDLRPALVDPAQFPFATFRQVMARELRRMENRPPSFKSPQGNQGNFQLRRSIADHIALTRAVACSPEDVLVTSGAQQAFDLIAQALVKPSETVVAIEDPGYPPMRVPFAAAGAHLAPVRVDAEGIVVDEIPHEASIICVCPSHQFPLGMSMSPSRRMALNQFAARTGAVVVEDDYDGEFRHDGSPLEALRTNNSADHVFYVGSFSKCMLPSLRLGFMVPPRWAMKTLVAVKNSLDWHCPLPSQLAVAAFIRNGHLKGHVKRLRSLYRERRDRLLAALGEDGTLRPVPSSYGMHIATLAGKGVDCERVSSTLARQGIKIHALDRYYLGKVTERGFVLSYATVGEEALTIAVDALLHELNRSDDHSGTASV